ncbi:transferrin-binding protein-like solute binding protein [Rhodalgimonas zhirmunskyi]|uniref:Transferrin-binding protein-like solute binding protein n=1 Tax=Rhodalgimonas zhirmunskyi TaxID=2964767 RepID=A0AAJ1X4S9_9RHOB|nr:transferrin-binding protein-like solute binding protein [Rhodoalgimonas zhirmunskyi]MDQ2093424.1 transferrin-binding protein-like solute binding protein [Rhodoalgimonas zhirmunskyi]
MIRQVLALSGFVLIAACGSTNPFTTEEEETTGETGGETTTETSTIPEELSGDLESVVYSPGDQTITVTGMTLDEVPVETVYRRNTSLDRNGYIAYTAQDDPLDRHFTAYVKQSNNSGSVRAGAISDGGQFNRVFQGGFYERDGEFTPPTPDEGLVSYAGTYIGLLNGLGDGGDLLPITDPTVPVELHPGQSGTIVGNIFFNVDFNNNTINGGITDRVWTQNGSAEESIALISTSIEDDGTFLGSAEFDGEVGTSIGSYGGIFGGPEADAVGGVVALNEWDGPGDVNHGFDSEIERGVFVLDKCGTTGANATVCASTNPGSGTP